MAVPVCLPLPDIPKQLTITIPGGAELASLRDNAEKLPGLCDVPMQLFNQIGPALAPLKPLFDILDTALQIFKCLKAVPEGIATFSPQIIFECLEELAKKVEQLLRLIPQLSVPFMILDTIDAIIAFMECLVGTIEETVQQTQALAQRVAQAADIGDPALDSILECSENDLAKQQLNTADAMGGIGTLLGVINIFLELLGMDPIPDVSTALDGLDPSEAIQPLVDIVDLLKEIRGYVPIP